jgi:hypothetical protein
VAGDPGRFVCLPPHDSEQHQVTRSALATPTFVQVESATPQTPQTSVSVPFSSDVPQTAGSLNVVVVGWNDTKGNAYQLAIGPTRLASAISQSIYYANNIVAAPSGTNAVTVAFSPAAVFPDVRIAEYQGVDRVNPLDVAVGSTGDSARALSGSAATSFATDLLVAGATVATGVSTVGSGYTNRVVTVLDGDNLQDQVATFAGDNSATVDLTSSGQWVMQLAAPVGRDYSLDGAADHVQCQFFPGGTGCH